MGDVLQGGLTFEAGRPGGASVWGKVGDFFGGLGRAAASVAPVVLAAAPVALAVGAHMLKKSDSGDAHARRRAIQQQQSARTNAQELDKLLKANNDFLPSTTRRVTPRHMDDIRDTRISLLKDYERNVANARDRRQNALRSMLADAAALTRGELPFTPAPEQRIHTPRQPVVEHHPEPRPSRHTSIADALDPAWGKPSKPPAIPDPQPIAIPRPPKSPQTAFAPPRPLRPVAERPAPRASPEEAELAHATVRQRHEAPVDTWQKLKQGGMLSDMEIKQLFHAIDLRYYGAPDEAGRLEAKALEVYAMQTLAKNMIAHAPRTPEGDVVLGGVPVRPEDAAYFARRDVEYFHKTDRHLSPKLIVSESPAVSFKAGQYIERQGEINRNIRNNKIRNMFIPNELNRLVPEKPPGVDIVKNIQEAASHSPLELDWFRRQVTTGARWDFKKENPKYENFGNFHYGVVGSAMGISEDILLRAAGHRQLQDKHSTREWGHPLSGPPYGDDPKDQYWIKQGIRFYNKLWQLN